uniref:PH domain-containing protein n=1 Tax=Taenia asiatica TaxID=60517 RepID=A0A0R3WB60_TAEAS
LKLVDSFWVKVGSQLQSFDENITEPIVLSTLQNEVSVLSALVGEVTEKTDSIYRLALQGSAGVIDKTAYKALKIEHLKLKKISRRLDNVRELMSHLGGEKARKPWLDLSPEGADTLMSAEGKVSDLVGSVYEVWLKQLELRELFKLTFSSHAPDQPFSVEVSPPKPNSNSISFSTPSNAAPHAGGSIGGLCCWRQRLRTSKSDSCLPCMQCLRQPERGHYHHHCRHYTASGESGFVSDSDNAWRRRHRFQRLHEPTALAEQRIRHHFRSLSFPLPINLLRCLLTSQLSESSKDESSTSNQVSSFEECTPVKAKQYHHAPANAAFLFPPHFPLNPRTVQPPIAVSPTHPSTQKYSQDCDLAASERPGSPLQPCDSIFSVLSSINVDEDDDDVENGAAGTALTAGEEEDSALVTSPTSYSFPHDTDNEVDESEDGELFAHLYLGNEYKGRRCLSRSLPSLLDKRPVGWSMLRSLEESVEQQQRQSQQQQGEDTTEEAYVPIIMLSEEAEDEAEGGDATLGVESHFEVGAGDARSRLAWSPFSCRSEDLASLAAALRLSPADSEKLSEVLRDGSEMISWLSGLEASLYVPAKASDVFSSDLLCRLRPELSRVELDKHLSELQYYAGRLEHWRQEVDTLIERHKARLVKLELQANKLLASDHGFLAFFPSWLDMITSRRSEVERELQSQVRLLDYINCVSSDTKKKLQEIENQARPAMSEARCIVEQLGGANAPATGVTDRYQSNKSYFRKSAPNIPALTERLQDLLERASELDPRSNLLRQPSIEALSDNQILRARLRSSLAGLHNLSSLSPSICMALQHQQTPHRHTDVSFPPPRPRSTLRWNQWKVLCVTLLFVVLSLFCYALLQPGWYDTEEVRHRCSGDYFLCFASVWPRSLCITIPSLSASSTHSPPYCFHPPPT